MAVGTDVNAMSWSLASWLGAHVLVIACTSHVQDLKDQKGDRAAERRTVPIIFGDKVARVSLVVGVLIWTAVCCGVWAKTIGAWGAPSLVASGIVYRLLAKRGEKEDKKTYACWLAWLLAIHLIPAFNLFY